MIIKFIIGRTIFRDHLGLEILKIQKSLLINIGHFTDHVTHIYHHDPLLIAKILVTTRS